MLYLLDANVLITASNTYYPIDVVPEFWEWLLYAGKQNLVKIPFEIMEEIKAGRKENDLLLDWINEKENTSTLILDEEVRMDLVQQVVSRGYAENLNDDEIEQIGRDPFLVAYALASPPRCVVTIEVSRPAKKRQNRKLPDVCNTFGVQWCDTFAFNRELGFRTSWRR
ncbi:MAG: DUF4411 family protein [Chloroflexales bacterium]